MPRSQNWTRRTWPRSAAALPLTPYPRPANTSAPITHAIASTMAKRATGMPWRPQNTMLAALVP